MGASRALDRRYSRKKGRTYSIHFNGDTSNAELLFRTISLANQLSIHGAVTDWCDELAQQIPGQSFSTIEKSIAKLNEQLIRKLAPEEVNTLEKTLWTEVQASTNRLRDHEEKFAKLSKEMKVTQTCEIAGFMKKVSRGQCFRTLKDIDHGCGGKTGACREFSLPRDHDDSEPVGWIRVSGVDPRIHENRPSHPGQSHALS